jgi:predicted permease
MARAVGANHQLAASIIVLTTLGAVLSINLGLFVLTGLGWIS